MTKILQVACSLAFIVILSETQAQEQAGETSSTRAIAEHAQAVRLGYDAAHLAHSLQYHQARTMLAEIGGYTRYGYSERITENNWFNSQIEELELQLPRMRKRAERIQVTEQDQIQFGALFAELEALLAASRKVHAAIKDGDLEAANRLYNAIVDAPYNAAVAAAHSLISGNDRAITMIRLKKK